MQMLSAQLSPPFPLYHNTLEQNPPPGPAGGGPPWRKPPPDLGLLYPEHRQNHDPIITLEKELEIAQQYLDPDVLLYDDRFLYHCDIQRRCTPSPPPKFGCSPLWKTSSSIISKTTAN
ncbi:MAG: hypothetical protein ACLU9S_18210 [Oscillospiraceae bacterium]